MSSVKRTYGSKAIRDATLLPPSSPVSELTSSPSTKSSSRLGRKRSFLDDTSTQNLPASKRRAAGSINAKSLSGFFTPRSSQSSAFASTSSSQAQRKTKNANTARGKDSGAQKQKQLTQLHFSLDTTVLRTCPTCSLTYTKGAPDDESLHRSHCARVQRGMEWGKEEERECKSGRVNVEEVESNLQLKNGAKGRIICFKADVGGKIGAKLKTLLETVNVTLSAPALTPHTLQASKAYLFLLSSESSSSSGTHREKIVGCVIAQRISTAMAIAPSSSADPKRQPSTEASASTEIPTISTSSSDDSSSLSLIPTPLPTPLGIPRLFVSSTHRRLGIASRLLSAAAATFIHGCPLDPKKGEVAFSQPTGLGKMVLEKWANGKGRVFEET